MTTNSDPFKYDAYLSDAARAVKYDELEIERLEACLHIGQRVRYSSVGEPGIDAGLGDVGRIIDLSLNPGKLARVLFDSEAEPIWMDARLLITDDYPQGLAALARALGLNHDQLRRAAQDGRLDARKTAGVWLSTVADVQAALDAGTLQRHVGRPSGR